MSGVVECIGRAKSEQHVDAASQIPMWKRQLAAAIIAMLPAEKADAVEILNYAGQLLDVELKPASQ